MDNVTTAKRKDIGKGTVLYNVSKKGASYFITFTNDYSRYGYVYLLKHKHEVFETFKVFNNEVENQLEKTIKAIRSDLGGEYISQEFKDYLKAYGIVQQLTPPYTPQHNDYALESAARILNMVPTKKVDKTPYELWHGKVPNLSYLKIIQSLPFNVEVEEHSLGDLNEPANYKAALSDPKFEKWLVAMNAEKQFINENKSGNLYLHQNAKVVKREHFTCCRHKKLLNSHSYSANYTMNLAKGRKTRLNGFLEEEIYMEQPEVYDPNHPIKYYASKSIYGLKQHLELEYEFAEKSKFGFSIKS
ncbi:retrotransposon protein, putative, ty1-copia subclass [Tanacetum coccineum]